MNATLLELKRIRSRMTRNRAIIDLHMQIRALKEGANTARPGSVRDFECADLAILNSIAALEIAVTCLQSPALHRFHDSR